MYLRRLRQYGQPCPIRNWIIVHIPYFKGQCIQFNYRRTNAQRQRNIFLGFLLLFPIFLSVHRWIYCFKYARNQWSESENFISIGDDTPKVLLSSCPMIFCIYCTSFSSATRTWSIISMRTNWSVCVRCACVRRLIFSLRSKLFRVFNSLKIEPKWKKPSINFNTWIVAWILILVHWVLSSFCTKICPWNQFWWTHKLSFKFNARENNRLKN